MKPPIVHQAVQPPPQGIDRSLNEDDDADHASEHGATDTGHDVRYESTVRDKPGLAGPTRIDFNFGPDRERRQQ